MMHHALRVAHCEIPRDAFDAIAKLQLLHLQSIYIVSRCRELGRELLHPSDQQCVFVLPLLMFLAHQILRPPHQSLLRLVNRLFPVTQLCGNCLQRFLETCVLVLFHLIKRCMFAIPSARGHFWSPTDYKMYKQARRVAADYCRGDPNGEFMYIPNRKAHPNTRTNMKERDGLDIWWTSDDAVNEDDQLTKAMAASKESYDIEIAKQKSIRLAEREALEKAIENSLSDLTEMLEHVQLEGRKMEKIEIKKRAGRAADVALEAASNAKAAMEAVTRCWRPQESNYCGWHAVDVVLCVLGNSRHLTRKEFETEMMPSESEGWDVVTGG